LVSSITPRAIDPLYQLFKKCNKDHDKDYDKYNPDAVKIRSNAEKALSMLDVDARGRLRDEGPCWSDFIHWENAWKGEDLAIAAAALRRSGRRETHYTSSADLFRGGYWTQLSDDKGRHLMYGALSRKIMGKCKGNEVRMVFIIILVGTFLLDSHIIQCGYCRGKRAYLR
jgi:hypothetical protein